MSWRLGLIEREMKCRTVQRKQCYSSELHPISGLSVYYDQVRQTMVIMFTAILQAMDNSWTSGAVGTKPWPKGWIWHLLWSLLWVNRDYIPSGTILLRFQLPPTFTATSGPAASGFHCPSKHFTQLSGQMQVANMKTGGTQRQRLPGETISSVCTMKGFSSMQWSLVWRQMIWDIINIRLCYVVLLTEVWRPKMFFLSIFKVAQQDFFMEDQPLLQEHN